MGTWYRGESSGAKGAAHGAFLHDLGDGMYFTDDLEVANVYATKRVKEFGGQPRVLRIEVENARLGRILDLTKEQSWKDFVKPVESHIRSSNENYGRSFQDYLKFRKIDINQIDVVIGREYLNGGIQMCILNRNGQTSPLARLVRGSMQSLTGTVEFTPRPMEIDKVRLGPWWQGRKGGSAPVRGPRLDPSAEDFYARKGGVDNGAAMFGMLLAGALNRGNSWAIRHQVKDLLASKYQDEIAAAFAKGNGVLVVILIQEPQQADVNGFKSQVLRGLILKPGVSLEVSLREWKSTDNVMKGPDRNCVLNEDYLWLDRQS